MPVTVLLPGSYDPITRGHMAVIAEAARRYDSVHVVVFVNPNKEYLFSKDDRLSFIRKAVEDYPNITVGYDGGLVVDYVKAHGIDFLFKGIRNETDLEYEKKMAEWNEAHGARTVFFQAPEEVKEISSTLLRNRLEKGEAIGDIVPLGCEDLILKSFNNMNR